MQNLIILYQGSDWDETLPFEQSLYDSKELRESYQVFADIAAQNNIKYHRAALSWYQSKATFSKAWTYDGKWEKTTNIHADIIFDKCSHKGDAQTKKLKIAESINFLNDPELSSLCTDKWLTYQTFPDLMPDTYKVNTVAELKRVIPQIKTPKIVLKPRFGSSAQGVKIINRQDLPSKITQQTLVQPCIQTNQIPGLADGVCDLRLIVVDGQIDHALIRKAAKNSFISNTSQGGKVKYITNQQIPVSIRTIAKQIDWHCKKYKSRIYTIDCMFDINGIPWLIELNGMPGFPDYLNDNKRSVFISFSESICESMNNQMN